MTGVRRLPIPAHGAAGLALGVLALVAPFALGLTTAGLVMAFGLGALAIGLALGKADATINVSTHRALDQALAAGFVAAAFALAIAGDAAAAATLGVIGAAQLGLCLITRYSASA